MSELDIALLPEAQTAKAWPFEEARRLIERLERLPGGADKTVIFETGYGPSGLPHIGTFGEVARTSMVRHAFEVLTEGKRKTRLVCFSDDMDGLRKVPTNVPNQEMLAKHLDKPLTSVPDPFGNVRELRRTTTTRGCGDFLDRFGFEYEFFSATECYKAGLFDATLLANARGLRQGDGRSSCRRSGPSGRRPIRRSCPFARAPARCCRCR